MTDGVGHGYLSARGRRVVNVGLVGPEGVKTLRESGCRVYLMNDTGDYALLVVVLGQLGPVSFALWKTGTQSPSAMSNASWRNCRFSLSVLAS